MKYSGLSKVSCEFSKLSKLNVFIPSDTRRALMHIFLFTNSAKRELVSICTYAINLSCIGTLIALTHPPQSKSFMIRAGTTCTVVLSSQATHHPVLTQHVLCNKCSLARLQYTLSLNHFSVIYYLAVNCN